jgi:hypothetical protein
MVALTSLPGVTVKLNWREWRVLQARTGWLAFVAATVSCQAGTESFHRGVLIDVFFPDAT